jgi:transcriptional regulator with XRE-family HTH domain
MILAPPWWMSSGEAFGLNLRRRRIRAGVSLETIARLTRVSVDLWEAMERNDFSQWPSGIHARAFIREYAMAIDVDANEAVNDFCRWFPQGDRRAERLVRGAAELVGHELEWQEDLPPLVQTDRRAARTDSDRRRPVRSARPVRLIAAAVDLVAVVTLSGTVVLVLPVRLWPTLAIAAVLYHGISLTLAGTTPAAWAIDTYLNTHRHFLRRGHFPLFRRFDPSRHDDTALHGRPISQ